MSLPVDSSKYGKDAFFEPKMFIDHFKKLGRLPNYDIPKNIIFTYMPTKLSFLDKSKSTKVISNGQKSTGKSAAKQKSTEAKKFFQARLDILPDNIGILSQFGMGAPALTLHLELLIALGAKRFIGVGTTGSLIAEAAVGDFILCNKALRDEGVSYHYVPPSDYAYPSEDLCKKIRKSFIANELAYKELPTWTTDAVYRETQGEIEKFRASGIATVDMEAAALFTVARYRQAHAASLFVISDLLSGPVWQPSFDSTSQPLEQLMKVAITALQN